jgi:type IV fimbrial biogenesis protein FimT
MGSRQAGLTLIELMVTLAVAIVLLAAGIPLYTGMVANNRAVTQANTFLSAFKLARSEAVRRSAPVSVCARKPAADPAECGTGNDWLNGLLVFSDGGTAGKVDVGDERIRVFTGAGSGALAAATTPYVRYGAQGDAEAASLTANPACTGSGTCLELTFDDTIGDQTRCLHVMQSGQVRLERGVCS